MRRLKIATFACFVLLVIVLATTSLLDFITGKEGVSQSVYTSLPFVLLWAILAILALVYIVRRHLWRRPPTLLLHLAFFVILIGALITHIFGLQGSMLVDKEKPINEFITAEGEHIPLPFTLQLDTFIVAYYPGTASAEDFISRLRICDEGKNVVGQVSMNKILIYRHYRFYQAGYDADGRRSKLSVAFDPYGIAITYTGYALLLLGMLLFLFQPNSRFRQLLRQKTALVTLLMLLCGSLLVEGKNMPKIAPTDIAEEFGDLYISYNGRICPVETYAHDFCIKLCGKPVYRHRKAEEVLCGWIFFPDTWKTEPMIKVKGGEVKRLLGTKEKYVTVVDCANEYGEYKLQGAMREIYSGEKVREASSIRAMDEKINILNNLFTGSSLKLFPVKSAHGTVEWYSSVDTLPQDIPANQARFIRTILDLLAEKIILRQYTEAHKIIAQIRQYQEKEGAATLPSQVETKAEKLYNQVSSSKMWAMLCLSIGILAFIFFTYCTIRERHPARKIVVLLNIVALVVWLYISLCIVLRTIISHHVPLSNGFETMQVLAWSTLLIMLFLQKRFSMLLPFGFFTSGAALLVAMMGESNPAVTSLMPVLNSPLLSIHVMVIMIAYALLAFIMLNGVTALLYSKIKKTMTAEVERLRRMSEIMLYPAVFLLTIGIFIGAIWANVSWGRYWGWDAKETWALITMMVFALPLHSSSIAWFRSPRHFHAYVALAFLAVLMTYFGANYFIAGLHSYV